MNRSSTTKIVFDDGYCNCHEICPVCGRRYRPSHYTIISSTTSTMSSVLSVSTGVDSHGVSFM